jgi:two-component system sensor histidine kinase PilS (NtrC family)
VASLYYQYRLGRPETPHVLLTWAQLLVDFGVVAATVSFTGGALSLFTFLFVIVILEAGLLLGQTQGIIIATLSTAFILIQTYQLAPAKESYETLTHWYGFLVKGLGYYLTAFISGYWNLRVYRMQQFQHEILDNMSNGFLITDRHGLVIAQNKAADRILELVQGAAVGRPVQDVLRVGSGAECPVVTALRTGRHFTSYEFHARTGAEAVKLLGLTTSPIHDSHGNLTGIIASFTDLTEMAKMREELKRQDRLAAVGELSAGLAHEIRNPVAAIRGAVDELKASIDTPEIAERLAAIAIRESDHLNRIVTDFLDFARRPEVRRETFSIVELVQEVAELVRNKYRSRGGLEIRAEAPPRDCLISGDRSQIKQVFMNIAKNGIEAMEERGVLSVAVIPDSTSVEVRFDDQGAGIPPDELARIFEPFYTTKTSGVGMGLAVCMRIVTAHDGTLRATPREGGGTSISVRLPTMRDEE